MTGVQKPFTGSVTEALLFSVLFIFYVSHAWIVADFFFLAWEFSVSDQAAFVKISPLITAF